MIETVRAHVNRWNRWQERSVNRRIFSAALTVGGMTLLVRLFSIGNTIVVARQFGAGDAMDAFLIAFIIPNFGANIVAGSFYAAFMPTFIQVRERDGNEAAQRLFSNIMTLTVGLLSGLVLLLIVLSPVLLRLLGSSFSGTKLALAEHLFYLLIPILVINGLATIWTTVLNADEKFALAALVPALPSLGSMIFVIVLARIWGIYAVAVGTLLGAVIQASLLGRALRRRELSLILRRPELDPNTKIVLKQFTPMVAGALIMGVSPLIDQAMAAMLGRGAVSELSYGTRIVAVVTAIGTAALGSAVLPHFSKMVAHEDWAAVRHTLKTYFRLIVLTTIPLTIGLVVLSEPIVRLLYQRGAFTAADTQVVSRVQMMLLLEIPFYTLGILVVRLISALKANRLLMYGAVINVIINAVLNYIFMIRMGVAGIGLSTVFVYIISFAYLFTVLMIVFRKEVIRARQ